MVQNIIKIGNSYGIILPKEIIGQMGLQVGDQVQVEPSPDRVSITIYSNPKQTSYKTAITPEFKKWVDAFMDRNKTLLKKLAKTP